MDTMDEDYKKNYYLHYGATPYCVGEVGKLVLLVGARWDMEI